MGLPTPRQLVDQLRAIHAENAATLDALDVALPPPPTGTIVPATSSEHLQMLFNTLTPGSAIGLSLARSPYRGNFVASRSGIVLVSLGVDVPDGERVTPEIAAARGFATIASPNTDPALRVAPRTAGFLAERVVFGALVPTLNDLILVGAHDTTDAGDSPVDITFDQCVAVGVAAGGTKNGVVHHARGFRWTNGSVAQIRRQGQETHGFTSWNGPGPFLIENNLIEAASISIFFGGSDPRIPGLNPTGATIRGNLCTKPQAWDNAGFSLKNMIEFKAMISATVEDNDLRGSFHDGQGYAVMLTPEQQGTHPTVQLRDLIFRNNRLGGAGGFNILGSGQMAAPTLQTIDVLIEDNDIETDRFLYGGQAWPFLIGRGPRNLRIRHNTIRMAGSNQIIEATDVPCEGFELVGNLALQCGLYSIRNFARGTMQNNAAFWQEHFPGGSIDTNAFVAPASPLRANLPTSNRYLPAVTSDAVYVDADGYAIPGTAAEGFGRRRP